MVHEIAACRMCGSEHLVSILNLGTQALTGVFPRSISEPITGGPLELVKCMNGCGLVQLRHTIAGAHSKTELSTLVVFSPS